MSASSNVPAVLVLLRVLLYWEKDLVDIVDLLRTQVPTIEGRLDDDLPVWVFLYL